MPVMVAKRGDKYRIVEAETGKIATHRSGTPVDGGGHVTREEALSQARAINRKKEEK